MNEHSWGSILGTLLGYACTVTKPTDGASLGQEPGHAHYWAIRQTGWWQKCKEVKRHNGLCSISNKWHEERHAHSNWNNKHFRKDISGFENPFKKNKNLFGNVSFKNCRKSIAQKGYSIKNFPLKKEFYVESVHIKHSWLFNALQLLKCNIICIREKVPDKKMLWLGKGWIFYHPSAVRGVSSWP